MKIFKSLEIDEIGVAKWMGLEVKEVEGGYEVSGDAVKLSEFCEWMGV